MRVCPVCGASVAGEGTICPVCKSDLLPEGMAEQEGAREEFDEQQVLLVPGAGLERWEGWMADAGRRRQARVALTVLAVAVLVVVHVLAWQSFVRGVWGVRLGAFQEIVFVGSGEVFLMGYYDNGVLGALPQLYVMRADGSGLRRLTDPAMGGYFSPAWSPDGTHLAAFRVDRFGGVAKLVIMRADGSEVQEVSSVSLGLRSFQVGNGVVNAPLTKLIAWSPDGSQLLAPVGQDSYVIVNADGTHPRPFNGDRPVWAPDGRHVAFYGLNRGGPIFNVAFFPIQLTGSPLVILDTQTLERRELREVPDLSVGALAWSPDGRYLGATTWRMDQREQQPVGGVVLLRPDGSDQHEVIEWAGGEVDQLSWSPDGRQLAAMVEPVLPLDQFGGVEANGPVDPQLWVVDSDSSQPRNLGKCDTDQPTWAPDGQHLLVVRYDQQASMSQIVLVDTSTPGVSARALLAADRQVFGEAPRYMFAPSWSWG